MIHNFSYLACHFHKVESVVWLRVREVINEMLLSRVKASSEFFTYKLCSDDFDTLRDFVEQMDTAYLHPRRDSFHVNFLKSIYSGFHVPANFRGRKSGSEHLPISETKKNLSQDGKPSDFEQDKEPQFSTVCLLFCLLAFLFLLASHIEYLFNLSTL